MGGRRDWDDRQRGRRHRCLRRQRAQDRFEEHGLAHGLGQGCGHAELAAAPRIPARPDGREHHDRGDADPGRRSMQCLGDLEAVHAGHLMVEEHERERGAILLGAPPALPAPAAPSDDRRLHAPVRQHVVQDAAVGRVVVDDERRACRVVSRRRARGRWPPAASRRRTAATTWKRAARARARSPPRCGRPSAPSAGTRSSARGRCRRTAASSRRRPA